MKTTNPWWKTMLILLLGGAVGPVRAVNPDYAPNIPCWRDGAGATRQVWTFDSNANPIAPGVQVNQPGSPTATLTVGTLGHGWYNTTCADGLNGCGTVALALLPLSKTCPPSNTKYKNSANGCALTYTDPPTLGDAQGYWDMGSDGGQVVLTIPNNGAPPGTIRYFYIQGTYLVAATVADLPYDFGVTNSASVGNSANDTNAVVTDTEVEQPLNASSGLSPNVWWNRLVVVTNAADTAAGNDTLTIDEGGSPFWVDAIIVETLDRVAGNDAVNTALNTATNIPFGQLLANDRGGNLVSVGGAAHGTVVTNAGNVVTFTPDVAFTGTASFWYTNVSCMGDSLSAQVTVNVLAGSPVANPDNYTRPKGASLKIKISDLLANDTDPNSFPLTVVGIDPQTTNGVHLAISGSLIVYTNSATPNANDQFGYTITNGQGGSATGLVSITVVGGQAGQKTGTIAVTGDTVGLVFYGIPGQNYQVQRSTNSGSSWTTIGGATANDYNTPPAGQVSYTDDFGDLLPTPGIPASALYRLYLP